MTKPLKHVGKTLFALLLLLGVAALRPVPRPRATAAPLPRLLFFLFGRLVPIESVGEPLRRVLDARGSHDPT